MIRIRQLGMFRDLKVQFKSLSFILSKRSFQETFLVMESVSGAPRYLAGRDPLVNSRIWRLLRFVIWKVLKKKI